MTLEDGTGQIVVRLTQDAVLIARQLMQGDLVNVVGLVTRGPDGVLTITVDNAADLARVSADANRLTSDAQHAPASSGSRAGHDRRCIDDVWRRWWAVAAAPGDAVTDARWRHARRPGRRRARTPSEAHRDSQPGCWSARRSGSDAPGPRPVEVDAPNERDPISSRRARYQGAPRQEEFVPIADDRAGWPKRTASTTSTLGPAIWPSTSCCPATRIGRRRSPPLFDAVELQKRHREFATATGMYKGRRVSCVSTGIGTDNVEIVIAEILAITEHPTFMRIGSCGVLREDIALGDLVITTGAVRLEATTKYFVHDGYPAVADYAAVAALVEAAHTFRPRGPPGHHCHCAWLLRGAGPAARRSFRSAIPTSPRRWPARAWSTSRWKRRRCSFSLVSPAAERASCAPPTLSERRGEFVHGEQARTR